MTLIARPTTLTLLLALAATTLAAAPATAPATDLKVTAQKHPDDTISITTANDETVITITSPSGIGDVTLERTPDKWPAKIRVVLQYSAAKPYTKLEGFIPLFGPGDGDRPVEYQPVVEAGTAAIKPPMAAEARKTLRLSWVDFYR